MKIKLLILKYSIMRKLGILKPAKSLNPYAALVEDAT